MTSKRVFICADHGLAVFYFLKSDIVRTLLQAGVERLGLPRRLGHRPHHQLPFPPRHRLTFDETFTTLGW